MLPTASEIINQSFSLYRRHWRTLAPFQLGLWLPLLIQFGLGILAIILDAAVPGMSLVNTIVTLAMVAAVAIFIIWNTLALVHTLGALTTGAPAPAWRAALAATSVAIFPAIYTGLLSALIIMAGTLLFIVPGVIFTLWYAFSLYVIVFEERAGWQSLQRSKRLVVGRWLPLLWRLAVPALVFSALTVLFDLLLAAWIPAFTDSEVWGKLLLNSVAALGGALFLIPLTLTAQIILYRAAAATLPATTEEDAS